MAKERRPRVPEELAERIDAVRKDIPFERWVRRALEGALGAEERVPERAVSAPSRAPKPRKPPAPRIQRGSPSPSLGRFMTE